MAAALGTILTIFAARQPKNERCDQNLGITHFIHYRLVVDSLESSRESVAHGE